MFKHIFLDKQVTDFRVVDKVRQFFPDLPIVEVDSREQVFEVLDHSSAAAIVSSGKKVLYLNNYCGEVVKFCPARSPEIYRCCNLHTINLMSNCIYNCVYCILQNCLTNPVFQVHCNLDHICDALFEFDRKINYKARICTGEIADSLALDHIFHHAEFLSDFIVKTKNLYLELKTKSDNVDTLLNIPATRRVIASFSINPSCLVKNIEFGAPSVEQRLLAARKLVDAGYRVAFNIDPMIVFKGWQDEYTDLIKLLKSSFEPQEIAWLHVGIMRFVPGLEGVARQRFPKLDIFDAEFVLGPDRKNRYPRPLRDLMYAHIFKQIRAWSEDITVFTCVEREAHWCRHYGWGPKDVYEVNNHVMKNL